MSFTMAVVASMSKLIKIKKTNYKETTKRLDKLLKEASEKYLIQNKFIAVTAHEMRNFATKYLN